jgi:hypothetical protein
VTTDELVEAALGEEISILMDLYPSGLTSWSTEDPNELRVTLGGVERTWPTPTHADAVSALDEIRKALFTGEHGGIGLSYWGKDRQRGLILTFPVHDAEDVVKDVADRGRVRVLLGGNLPEMFRYWADCIESGTVG